LPDISKINALAIGSVSKVDGLAKASILDIDGVAVPPAIAAPAAAYSVRLLGSGVGVPTYTGAAMRVRRDTAGGTGDDDEADIAFDSGVISLDSAISNASAGVTATTLGQFLNVGTVGGTTYTNPDSLTGTAIAYIPEWKDQSGNNANATQSVHSLQRRIHNGTTDADLQQSNGQPTLFASSGGGFEVSLPQLTTPFCSMVFDRNNNDFTTWTPRNSAWMALGDSSTSTTVTSTMGTLTAYKNGSQMTITTRAQFATDIGSDQLLFTHTTTQAQQASTWKFATYYTNNTAFNIKPSLQENIMWGTDQSDNRTGIESDINGFFGIY